MPSPHQRTALLKRASGVILRGGLLETAFKLEQVFIGSAL